MEKGTVDKIREDQTRFGREANKTSTYQGNGGKSRKPFVPKGHDAILSRLQESKTVVALMLISGVGVNGVIVARDKFTITMNVSVLIDENGRRTAELNPSATMTFYKHGIESFAPKFEGAA